MIELGKRRVYYFVNRKFGVENIRRRRVKVSTILGVNDPFEFLGNETSSRVERELLSLSRALFHKEFGMICFSKSCSSPVQWAHYADRHKGICLGFDVSAALLRDVSYSSDLIQGSIFPSDVSVLDEWSKKLLSTKYIDWAYEKEARLFTLLSLEEGGLYFREFDAHIELKEVQIGFHCEASRSEILEALGELASTVNCFKVRPAFKSFNMVRNLDELLWK